ncbi:MAG: hypothetical protein N2F24_09920 [Deltaproteobacteria bacterium]
MMGTSVSICLPAPIAGSGKSGFSALGVAAQEKLYAVEHVPSSPGGPGPVFSLLSLAHAAVGILPSLPEMAHSATVRSGIIDLQATPKCALDGQLGRPRNAASDRPSGTQTHNLMNPYGKIYYAPKGQPGTRERKP